jgi:hypothetical protein
VIEDFEEDVDELDVDYPNLRKFARTAHEFTVYITSNAGSLINYGERYRAGERISSCLAESTVNAVISKRFAKRQQMQWTPRLETPHFLMLSYFLSVTQIRSIGSLPMFPDSCPSSIPIVAIQPTSPSGVGAG